MTAFFNQDWKEAFRDEKGNYKRIYHPLITPYIPGGE
jgi:hypothetical protein